MSKEGAFIMAHRKVVAGLSGFLVALAAVLVLGGDVMSKPAADENVTARADLIMITIAGQGELEMPASVFMHDKHTAALKEQDKDCSACHKTTTNESGEEVMSLKFMRTEDGSFEELKNIYHDGCISCHAEDRAAGVEKYGPQSGECRSCHVENPQVTAVRLDSGMDNALHYRHWGSDKIAKDAGEETNCGSCHHEWDEQAEKLVYKKFEEESCSYCHTDTPEEPVKTPRQLAFHQQCVVCHQTMSETQPEDVGPVDCAGCHSAEGQQKIEQKNETMQQRIGKLPRLPRKQPDAVLMTPPIPEDAQNRDMLEASAMPVAFDHLYHEETTDSCSSCHHKSVQACSECHTVQGSEKGDFIALEQAMHQVSSEYSCVGCHQQEQARPECAGCHAAMPTEPTPAADSCTTCHQPVEPAEQAVSNDGIYVVAASGQTARLPKDKDAREALAKRMIERRPDTHKTLAVGDIPETVTIGVLADEYKPSEMPHRKIVLKLLENMQDNQLASVFHETELTMCQGCHHNSPASKTPPRCASCHGEPFMEARAGRPGLKAAYHGQCMDCHTEMKLEKPANTDCVACHEKKE